MRPAKHHRSADSRPPRTTTLSKRVAVAVAVYAAAGIACHAARPPSQTAGPVTLAVGVPESSGTPTNLGMSVIIRMITTEGLTAIEPDGRVSGQLVERWSSSPDGLAWQFTVRSGIRFSDGAPADAPALKGALDAALASPGERMMRPGLADITDVTAPAPGILNIRLSRRSAFLLDDLDINVTRTIAGNEVTTGPFRVVGRSPAEVELVANTAYYLGRPSIDRLLIRSFPTLRMAWASLLRGEVDALHAVARDVVEFVSNDQVRIYPYRRSRQYLIAFNASRPALAMPVVRRALNAAVDRDALIRTVLHGAGQPSSGPLWPDHWAYDRSISHYTFERSLAAATLDAAGLRPGSAPAGSGRLAARLRFTCLVPKDLAELERLALHVQKQLYDIGVDMQLESVTLEEYDRRLRSSSFDAAIIDMWSGPSFTRPYLFWRSPAGFRGLNVFGYHNTEADRWFDALRHAPDDGAYRAAAGQLQRTLLDDPPALFLAWNEQARAVSRRFTVAGDPGSDVLRRLRQWHLNPEYTGSAP